MVTTGADMTGKAGERVNYGAENGTWRSFFLSGATELREGRFGTLTETTAPDVMSQLTPQMLSDALAIQIDRLKAWDENLSIDIVLTDTDAPFRLRLANGVLTYSAAASSGDADATITTTRRALPALALGLAPEQLAATGIQMSGDVSVLARLTDALDPGDKNVAIVTP